LPTSSVTSATRSSSNKTLIDYLFDKAGINVFSPVRPANMADADWAKIQASSQRLRQELTHDSCGGFRLAVNPENPTAGRAWYPEQGRRAQYFAGDLRGSCNRCALSTLLGRHAGHMMELSRMDEATADRYAILEQGTDRWEVLVDAMLSLNIDFDSSPRPSARRSPG